LIAKRKEAGKDQGPVLVLDAGDYSMGTAFGAATREIGGELQVMSRMGYDATTFGNHEFDYGPEGLGKSIGVAAKAGRIPAVPPRIPASRSKTQHWPISSDSPGMG
jgi:5'-nucleotidase